MPCGVSPHNELSEEQGHADAVGGRQEDEGEHAVAQREHDDAVVGAAAVPLRRPLTRPLPPDLQPVVQSHVPGEVDAPADERRQRRVLREEDCLRVARELRGEGEAGGEFVVLLEVAAEEAGFKEHDELYMIREKKEIREGP